MSRAIADCIVVVMHVVHVIAEGCTNVRRTGQYWDVWCVRRREGMLLDIATVSNCYHLVTDWLTTRGRVRLEKLTVPHLVRHKPSVRTYSIYMQCARYRYIMYSAELHHHCTLLQFCLEIGMQLSAACTKWRHTLHEVLVSRPMPVAESRTQLAASYLS
jgi:hypothetical protein